MTGSKPAALPLGYIPAMSYCLQLTTSCLFKWYGSRDLNSHILRYRNLNPARLPIPPNPHFKFLLRISLARVGCFTAEIPTDKYADFILIYSNYMAGIRGFEPLNDGIKTRCLTAWLYPYRGSNNIDFYYSR